MKEAISRFKENISTYKLVSPGDTIIIGSSGGPDSQFLTYLFASIKEEYKLDIILAHLNHLHRLEASYDEDLVIKTAHNLGLRVRVKQASMDEFAKKEKISPEDAGRRLRYEFFNQILDEYENAKIAVAHNKNDQAETIIMRIVRGTGLEGLAAMNFKRENLIRPILNFHKSEILSFLDMEKIPYAIDQTNFSNDYTRNYVRNEIIPRLETINPQAVDNICRLGDLARDNNQIVEYMIDDLYKKVCCNQNEESISFEKKQFEDLSDGLKSQLLRKSWENLEDSTKDLSSTNIRDFISLEDLENGKRIIKDKIEFVKTYDAYILKYVDRLKLDTRAYLNIGDKLKFNGYTITAKEAKTPSNKSKARAYFPMKKLSFPLLVRTRENGDRFKPYGFNHTKKLKDFFIDQKVERQSRDQIPLILSNNDIIWVVGLRQSEDYKVRPDDESLLMIEVSYDN